MVKIKDHVDERILVCVYYGPNGERLIKRGHKLAKLLDSPMYVLTVDELPYDKFDAEKSGYIEHWEELSDELKNVEEFILKDNEKRPTEKVIAEIAHQFNVTQVVIGQTPQNRWEEITKGNFVNALQRELSSFIDIHIVSVDRAIRSQKGNIYEKGVRAFLQREEGKDFYTLTFTKSKNNQYEGIFYKEIGTDFNNGIFKFIYEGKTYQVDVHDNVVRESIKEPPNV
ncbi:MAG TPA: histidine kinase [Bacillota bacterium]|nr:histidine kinase [Bacillota bacterium]